MILSRSFYTRTDVVQISRDLLGKFLVSRTNGVLTSGMICETEAYAGITDRASHAYGGRRTARTEIMYAVGGTAYIYLCYGFHSLFNVVTNSAGVPDAVLIRGIVPEEGKEIMLHRSGKKSIDKNFAIGPGKVSKIMGIHYSLSGIDLVRQDSSDAHAMNIENHAFPLNSQSIRTDHPRIPESAHATLKADHGIPGESHSIWIEDRGLTIASNTILAGPRVGIDYAGEDVHKPYRFRLIRS